MLQLLKNINVEKDNKRKREIIKKVIAYMTLGIDVSRLFPDMIMVRLKLVVNLTIQPSSSLLPFCIYRPLNPRM